MMIKNILFDFDGVILDSMKIKGDGFVELFSDHGNEEQLKLIEQYHYDNGGVSRFDKIKYFFNILLNKDISKEDVQILSNKFATIINKKLYNTNNLITETVNFIKNHNSDFNFHIVSAAEHDELNNLCKYLNINQYFISIHGSPIQKSNLIHNIMNKYHYKIPETILIGDSINDYRAAQKNKIVFFGYNNQVLKSYKYINTFKSFHP